MRSDKLQNAIGMVDGDLVTRAEKEQKPKRKALFMKWTAPIAAVLVIALCVGIFFGNESPFVMKVHAIAEAKYPEMAKYPNENLPNFTQKYAEWRTSKNERRTYFGAGEDLDGFIRTTTAEILSESGTQNRIYSPLNVYMALAMLAEITDGDSRAQILDLLGADSIEALRTEAHAVWNANYCDDGSVTSILASSLWLNEDIAFNGATLETLAENYYASSYQGTMGSKEFNKALQSWLNEQTGGLLEDQISDIEMTPETILALATTIYFRAKWAEEFSEATTAEDIFHGAERDTAIDFMNQTLLYGDYYWGEKFSATAKNLEESGQMWFILPDEGVSVDELLTDAEALAFLTANGDWENQKRLRVNLSVPKFDVDSNLDLEKNLKNLGVIDCFNASTADFTPLLAEEQTAFLSSVEHGARVAIDEKGVTAAAYTVMMIAGSPQPPEDEIDFVLDRPFIFVITGSDGLPLFIGMVNQP